MADIIEFNKLREEALGCNSCSLRAGCSQVVFGTGPVPSQIMFIGEAPGYHEDKISGKPFTGPAGDFFNSLLKVIELKREDVFISNTVLCRPLVDKNGKDSKPKKAERDICVDLWLKKQIEMVNPRVIVLLGGVPLSVFVPGQGIEEVHGSVFERDGKYLIPLFHPSHILQKPVRTMMNLKDWQTLAVRLQMLKETGKIVGVDRESEDLRFVTDNSGFSKMMGHLWKADIIAIDTETNSLDRITPTLVGMSFAADNTGYFIGHELVKKYTEVIRKLIMSKTMVAHNWKYDYQILKRTIGLPRGCDVHDTMIIAHLLGIQPLGLKALSLKLLGREQTHIEDLFDEKKFMGLMDQYTKTPETIAKYACLSSDSLVVMPDGTNKYIIDLVKSRYNGEVRSYNQTTQEYENRRVTGWHEIKTENIIDWYSISTNIDQGGPGGVQRRASFTRDHKILTTLGWKEVHELSIGEQIITPIENFSSCQRQLILGSLLGDGTITKRNKGGWGQFRVAHSDPQHDYTRWFASWFDKSQGFIGSYKHTKTSYLGEKPGEMLYFETKSHPWLKWIEEKAYPNNRLKTINNWAKELTWLSLAVWYMDDGTLCGKKAARFYTDGFSLESVKYLQDLLISKFQLMTGIREQRTGQWAIQMNVLESDKFFKQIAQFIPQVMQYKLPIKYQGLYNPNSFPCLKREPLTATILGIEKDKVKDKSQRRHKTQYCLDVEGLHNFCTPTLVVHNCDDALSTLKLFNLVYPKMESLPSVRDYYLHIEKPLVEVTARIEQAGMMVDLQRVNEVNDKLTHQMQKINEEIVSREGPELNIRSPKQLTVLFNTKKADKEVLNTLAENGNRTAKLILEYRQYDKLKTSYAETLPDFIHPASLRVHGNLLQTGAITGRFSITNPALQTIPVKTEVGKTIRKLFTVPLDYYLLSCDFSQLELRILAHFSQDDGLINAFKEGKDIHSATCMKLFGVVDEYHRKIAKNSVFCILYGGKAAKIAFTSGIYDQVVKEIVEMTKAEPLEKNKFDAVVKKVALERATNLLDSIYREFPGVKTFQDQMEEFARKHRWVESLGGRKIILQEMYNVDLEHRGLRQATNFVIQSSATDVMKAAMIIIDEALLKYDAKMINQIHDEVLIEVHKSQALEVADLVRNIMATAMPISVPLKVDAEIGKDWGSIEDISKIQIN